MSLSRIVWPQARPTDWERISSVSVIATNAIPARTRYRIGKRAECGGVSAESIPFDLHGPGAFAKRGRDRRSTSQVSPQHLVLPELFGLTCEVAPFAECTPWAGCIAKKGVASSRRITRRLKLRALAGVTATGPRSGGARCRASRRAGRAGLAMTIGQPPGWPYKLRANSRPHPGAGHSFAPADAPRLEVARYVCKAVPAFAGMTLAHS